MTRRSLILLAGLGSLAMLLGAFGFQYIGGLAPCTMCLWQRWPHAGAIALAAIGAALPNRLVASLGGLTMLGNAGIALFHTGVEREYWEGPSSCTTGGQDLTGLSGAELLSLDAPAPIVMCDVVVWELAGLSMASWNGIICVVLAVIWFMAAGRRRTKG